MDLYDAFLSLKTKEDIHLFLKDLCTPAELAAMTERWKVCQLLQEGSLSYRQIRKTTGASLTTIGRVARFLKEESNFGYQRVLERKK